MAAIGDPRSIAGAGFQDRHRLFCHARDEPAARAEHRLELGLGSIGRRAPTARALAMLAITPEEQRFAAEAARIADHEVDLAFADALRQAAEQRPAQDPKSRDLYLKMQQGQSALADVLSRIEQLKAKIATAKPGEKDALQEEKDLLDDALKVIREDCGLAAPGSTTAGDSCGSEGMSGDTAPRHSASVGRACG